MANIWCCQAAVSLKEPLNIPGYPKSSEITLDVKVRTEGEMEPSGESIIKQAKNKMNACYSAVVLSIHNPITNFLLWEKV